ncbi:MAG: glycosyltransferase [Acidimicrobiales bacterium]
MRVAIMHERFTEYGGSEKVVEELHRIWPQAQILTSVCDYGRLPGSLPPSLIRTSPLQYLYRGRGSHARFLPAIPLAIKSMRAPDVDVVISSHHAFANQLRLGKRRTRFVCYVHSPARWVWDPTMVRGEPGGRLGEAALRTFAAAYRPWDRAAAQRPDLIIANSSAVQQRVRSWWCRPSVVVHPPVDTEFYRPGDNRAPRDDFFLFAGRLVPYKRPEVAVAAANRTGLKLVVAGEGRLATGLERSAGPTVEMRGRLSDAELRGLYQRCRALVQPGIEDFGITAVEAQACGAPVIARAAGGALDTVIDGVTGHLYDTNGAEGQVSSLSRAMESFASETYRQHAIVDHAQQFGRARFRDKIQELVEGRAE